MKFQIEVPKRSRVCEGCEQPFQAENAYFSSLFLCEEGGYERKDYCATCWTEVPRNSTVAFWRGVVSQKKEVAELPKNKEERAMVLLKQALAADNEEDKMEAFYLALYLQRQKVLILRKDMPNQEGERIHLYENAENEEMIAVPRVDITKGALQNMQRKLASQLSFPASSS